MEWNDEAGEFLNAPLTGDLVELSVPGLKNQRVGPWELIGELGRGGTATVYLARRADDLYEKQVAIKVLNRLSHSQAVFRRFQRELQILARVEHDNIVRLLEAGVTDQALAYIVTEYVDGKRIDEFAAPLPLHEKLQLFVKVCDAVSFAHHRHILHRDLKPSNILVTETGAPKLLDFGIAVLLDRDSRLTETGFEYLTMRYASPEQVRIEKQIRPSADLYSLGVILYELVAGHSPYGGAQLELGAWILAKDPLPLSDAPKDLQAIIWKALRKTAAERYACVQDLKDDIARFLQDNPIVARGPGRLSRLGRTLRRYWRPISLVAAGVALGLIAAIAPQKGHQRENHATRLSLETVEGRPLSFGLSPDGKRVFCFAASSFGYMDCSEGLGVSQGPI